MVHVLTRLVVAGALLQQETPHTLLSITTTAAIGGKFRISGPTSPVPTCVGAGGGEKETRLALFRKMFMAASAGTITSTTNGRIEPIRFMARTSPPMAAQRVCLVFDGADTLLFRGEPVIGQSTRKESPK